MGKIGIIIWREYSTRVRNKTFIIMSLLGPILVAGFITLMVWLPNSDKTEQKIMVVDETDAINISKLPDTKLVKFYYPKVSLEEAKKTFYKSDFTGILYIAAAAVEKDPRPIFYCKKSPSFSTENYIKTQLEKKFFEWRLASNSINPVVIHNSKVSIDLATTKIDDKGGEIETRNEYAGIFGFACAVLIFFFVTVYGMQVMRSVMEEKTNRIVEVIVSSVKPFQLMLGKIIGVACVGITQFIIWMILSTTLTTVSSSLFLSKVINDTETMEEQKEVVYKQGSNANFQEMQKPGTTVEAMEVIKTMISLDVKEILLAFFLYFLGGYLLYSALFAAIGSAVDAEADTQQFMLPIMLPLIAGYMMTIGIVQNPESNTAFWGSMIPFTSPIVMMARLPFGVPAWQIWLSLALLVAGFLFTTWLAGKIYRTGILMYGKKISWKELGKWIMYKG
jgi:ABC-2 type transport system permease protein